MALSSSSQLGSFKILAPLSAGGMGELYRATVTKLDREVAIKILPEVANDPERLARLTREAKVLASLSGEVTGFSSTHWGTCAHWFGAATCLRISTRSSSQTRPGT